MRGKFGVFYIACISIQYLVLIGCAPDQEPETTSYPNIIYILADDLGYGELGIYGQELIETPSLDVLAESGIKFTQHYAGSAVCAPSRYMLMTGKHPGNAYIRGNNEWADRGDVWSYEAMYENPKLEGQKPIPAETVTLAEILRKAGYKTGAIGKWGLGGPYTKGHPNRQGFDFFYGYLCQRQAHTYYPTHLWRNEERIYLDNELVDPKQSLPDNVDPYNPDNYTVFHDHSDFSADLMHIEALRFIEENHHTHFFLYLPTPIPHVSLQAPQRWIDYYHQKFGDEEPFIGGGYVPARYPNATYAAMISYLDEQVGGIVDKLKELDIYENSLIIFTSDNGPTFTGGVDAEFFESASPFKNTYGWTKGYLHEGGIRVPMIAAWEGIIPAGSSTDHISAFWDVMPTFAEIVGTNLSETDGISFLATLKGNEQDQKNHEFLYWEFPGYGGQQAVRMDNWKGLRKNVISKESLAIELYNLDEDIQEQYDLADQYPEIVKKIELIMENERTVPQLKEFRMPVLGD